MPVFPPCALPCSVLGCLLVSMRVSNACGFAGHLCLFINVVFCGFCHRVVLLSGAVDSATGATSGSALQMLDRANFDQVRMCLCTPCSPCTHTLMNPGCTSIQLSTCRRAPIPLDQFMPPMHACPRTAFLTSCPHASCGMCLCPLLILFYCLHAEHAAVGAAVCGAVTGVRCGASSCGTVSGA